MVSASDVSVQKRTERRYGIGMKNHTITAARISSMDEFAERRLCGQEEKTLTMKQLLGDFHVAGGFYNYFVGDCLVSCFHNLDNLGG